MSTGSETATDLHRLLSVAQKRSAELGGQVVMAAPREFIRKTLRTLGLDKLFAFADTVDEAVAKLKSA